MIHLKNEKTSLEMEIRECLERAYKQAVSEATKEAIRRSKTKKTLAERKSV